MNSNACYSVILIITAFYLRVKLKVFSVRLGQLSKFLASSSIKLKLIFRQVMFVFIDSSAGVEVFIDSDLFILVFHSGKKPCF